MSLDSISQTIDRAMKSAGLDTRSPALQGVAATIHNALAAAGIAQRSPRPDADDQAAPIRRDAGEWTDAVARKPHEIDAEPANEPSLGTFVTRNFSNAAGARNYKLYVPPCYSGEPMPLLLMLHGCKQNPDDFAAGTRMNELAQQHGLLVAYPEQPRPANGSNCWNWFQAAHQGRGGEPSILAGIVGDVAAQYRIDSRRVFVAGLSAGAAMAVILGESYPEVFAAIGVHSGLPLGAAHDVASAFKAMHGGTPARAAAARSSAGVATIVFHGDHDKTVVVANAGAIVGHAIDSDAGATLQRETTALAGCTRTVFRNASGRSQVEQWLVHGGGHAWSGGSPKGSFTQPGGADASAEMVRFFLDRTGPSSSPVAQCAPTLHEPRDGPRTSSNASRP